MGIGAMHKHLGLRALSAPATHITQTNYSQKSSRDAPGKGWGRQR